ncbi:PAS domain S-box protein [Halogranum rubrum]|nr:PAS domain S-box protein [Halogranum rubrum]
MPVLFVSDDQRDPTTLPTGEFTDYILLHTPHKPFKRVSTRIQTLVATARERDRADKAATRLERTLERTTDGVYTVDTDWRIEYVNETMANRVGYERSQLIGNVVWDVFPSLLGTDLERTYRQAMECGEPTSFNSYIGAPFDYWVETRVFPDETGLSVFSREVTEVHEQRQRLERSATILENVHDVVFIIDETFEIQFANPAAARVSGYPSTTALVGEQLSTLIGNQVTDDAADAFSEAVADAFSQAHGDGGVSGLYDSDLQLELTTAFGIRSFDVRLTPCTGRHNEVLVVARDVTEQSEAQRQLETERDALRSLQEVMADTDLTTVARLGCLLEVGCETLDLEMGVVTAVTDDEYHVEAVHAPGVDIDVSDVADLAETYCAEVFEQERVCSVVDAVDTENEPHSVSRELGLESYFGIPLTVDGERFGALHFSGQKAQPQEFTESSTTFLRLLGELVAAELARSRNRRQLEATNTRLESLIEAAPLTIMEVTAEGVVSRWNRGAEEMFGWNREEIVGEFAPFVPAENHSDYKAHREQALAGEAIHGKEVTRQTKDGTVLDLLLSTAPVRDSEGAVTSILAVMDDITEQKEHERQLRALQEIAQRLTAASSIEAIGEIAVDAAAQVLGLEVTSVWRYAKETDSLVPIAETKRATELFGVTPTLTSGDGLAWEAFEHGALQVYDDVSVHEGRFNPDTQIRSEIIVPLGRHGLLATGSTGIEEFSEREIDLFRILGASVEVAMIRAKREATLQEQNNRLSEFTDVVAHDLRNPLAVAIGYLDAAKESQSPEHFEKVSAAHDRIEQLISNLLTLARGEAAIEDALEFDVADAVSDAWGFVETDEATLEVHDGVPVVKGDRSRVIQLFENLFRNAIEHGGDDVTIGVGPLAEGGFYVEDDGPGIPPERRSEVLESGVSYGSGTGFGLSIVAAIVRAHGWDIEVTASSTGGARFEFAF